MDRARTFAPPSAERKSGWPKPPVPPVKKGVRPPSPFAPARALVPEWKGYLVGPPRGPFGGIGKVALRTAVAGTLDWVAKAVRAASAAKPRKRGNAPLRRRRVRGKRGPSGLLLFPRGQPVREWTLAENEWEGGARKPLPVLCSATEKFQSLGDRTRCCCKSMG